MYKICQTEKSLARQRKLENGFLDYLETVSFNQITIAELCRYLQIPRKTFYRYFDSKEDILYALIDHRLVDMDEYVILHFRHPGTFRQGLFLFFSFWERQKRFLDILKQNHLLGTIFSRINSAEFIHSRKVFYGIPHYSSKENLFVHSYHMSGLMSILIHWYLDHFQKSISEMADIVESIYSVPFKSQFQHPQ